jgi:hypothetical protein
MRQGAQHFEDADAGPHFTGKRLVRGDQLRDLLEHESLRAAAHYEEGGQ